MGDVCRRCGAPRNGKGECDYCEAAPAAAEETVLRRSAPPAPQRPGPPPRPAGPGTTPGRRPPRASWIVPVVGVLLLVLVIGLGVVLLSPWDDGSDAAADVSPGSRESRTPSTEQTPAGARSSADPSLVAPCAQEPQVRAVDSATSGAGANVRLAFQAACPGGQYVDGTGVHVGLQDQAGRPLADAVYDFSSAPLWLPGDRSQERTLTFPSLQVDPDELGQLVDSDSVLARCDASMAGGGAQPSTGQPAGAQPETTYTPQSPAPSVDPEGEEEGEEDQEALSLASLRETAAEDQPSVAAELEGWWVPQLSSKELGTVADGHSFGYTDIYDEHQRLRDAFPDVRLLDSGSWKSFRNPGFWVTVAGLRFGSPEEANAWCDQQGFRVDDCLAKRILLDGPPDHATVTRK